MTSAATGCDDRRAMPIYDYHCDHCGHSFSQVQSYSDEPVAKCPNCGKKPRRLIAPAAVVFKGSGWYKTDSRPADKSEQIRDEVRDQVREQVGNEAGREVRGQGEAKGSELSEE